PAPPFPASSWPPPPPGSTGSCRSATRNRADARFMGAKYFGASVKRREDPRFLRGEARYVDDVKLPGMLHVAFLRSPHAHARLAAIRTTAAAAMPGVVRVFTH